MSRLILHVEDDPNDLLIIGMAFKKAAPEVRLVQLEGGQAAIDYLSEARNPKPHLILLDLKLPRMSGLEILDWIRKAQPYQKTPVVILSSSKDPADLTRAQLLGVTSYLIKPIDVPRMRELIREIAQRAALEGSAPISR